MVIHRAVNHLRSVLIWLCLLALCSLTLAQGSATPLQIGQNAIGTLTATASTAQYTVTATAGETAQVLVLAVSPGFAASVTVTNPAGVAILSLPNTSALSSISGSVSFDDAGVYTIEVASANGTFGQFALSLQAGTPLPQPVDLTVNQPITDTVGSAAPVRVYRFSTSSDTPALLTILSASSAAGMLVSLYDEDTSKTIASNDAGISGIAYRLPPQDKHYHVEIHASGAAGDVSFTICLGDCGGGLLPAPAATQTVAVTAVVTAAQVTCTVAPGISGSVNVRSGPSTIYAIIGNLSGAQTAPVLGQLSGGSWLEINLNGQTGWVAASVTKLAGDCTALVTVAPPASAPLAPTLLPPTAPPAAAPTNAPSNGGSPHPTAVPTKASAESSLPDLVVSISNATYSDSQVDITYAVQNVGNQNAFDTNVPYNMEICASTVCVSASGTHGLSAATVTFYYYAPQFAISIPITVTVDTDNKIAESNENNNTAYYTISLHSPSSTIHR